LREARREWRGASGMREDDRWQLTDDGVFIVDRSLLGRVGKGEELVGTGE